MSTTDQPPKPRWCQFSLLTLLTVAFIYTVVQSVLAMLWRSGLLSDALLLLFIAGVATGLLSVSFAVFLASMQFLSWLQQDK